MSNAPHPSTDALPRTGMLDVLRMAFPLILASSGQTIRMLADRVMLAHYSQEAIAASMPAGLACFTLMCFFMGTAGYANAFVAQYTGARRPDRVGLAIWQGLHLSLIGGILIALAGVAGPALFRWMGHAPAVQVQQVAYFQVLCQFSAPALLLSTLLTFWSGRGNTRVVMAIELGSAALNVLLNWMLIFGHAGCPELGVYGAGLATGLSAVAGLLVAGAMFVSPRNRAAFGTLPARTFDRAAFLRLLRFGAPNGMQFMLDLLAFNLFIAMLGRMGTAELEAANVAFGLNAVTFMPLIGLGMTVSILVGQSVGAGHPDHALRAVRNARRLALVYCAVMAVVYLGATDLVLAPFVRADDPGQVAVMAIAARTLRYITAYLAFDAFYIIYSHAIKGAGDTRFSMLMSLAITWGMLVVPSVIAVHLGATAWTLWGILVVQVMGAGAVFYLRYRSGRWRHMRVVEDSVVPGEPPGRAVIIELDRA